MSKADHFGKKAFRPNPGIMRSLFAVAPQFGLSVITMNTSGMTTPDDHSQAASRDHAFVASRRVRFPSAMPEWSKEKYWFNLWRRKIWPYKELIEGDTLYWYESPTQKIVWMTRVTEVLRFSYQSVPEALDRLAACLGKDLDRCQPYLSSPPESGYCLAWRVQPVERMDIPKPRGFSFPRHGWLRVNNALAYGWTLSNCPVEGATIDELAPARDAPLRRLLAANDAMRDVCPNRIKGVVTLTIRKDTPIVRALKELCDYRCQFPGCGVRILKKDGGYYAEVAHIHSVSQGGLSVLGNLVVLCPNHHKAFDYGHLEISAQDTTRVTGRLNGQPFEIRVPTA